MLAFYPEFESASSLDGTTEIASSFEVIFVIDLSNSMKGSAIQDAIKVVLLSLHHLPSTCSFNVVTFGTGANLCYFCFC
jgi:poly [ADP-ribose] polymerase 2/3/4